MQGWLFKSDPAYWTASFAKALLTSVPQVTNFCICIFFLFVCFCVPACCVCVFFCSMKINQRCTNSLPKGRMLILDLQAELEPQYIRLESFYGQPFVFCLLHNFGGTLGLNGAIPIISQVNKP